MNKNNKDRGKGLEKKEEEVRLVDADDLIQYFLGDPQAKKHPNRKNDTESFSLITFLENDGKRLDKLIDLFSSKLGNHQKYNQSGQLLENQNDLNENLKEQIIDYSRPLFSPFNKSMSGMFDKQFKKH